jgi:oligopeptide transport system ATP-binding protein
MRGKMEPVLRIKDLKTEFFTYTGVVKAVRGIDFSVNPGEAVGIVGESGCGKTVTGLSIMRLITYPPGKIVSGEVSLDGTDLLKLPEPEMRKIRGAKISMIFQDPMTSLNPALTIGFQLSEMLILHKNITKEETKKKIIELLSMVRIKSPENVFNQYPHQLSGGMRQRAMIALALSCEPKIVIADEPTTSVDVTIQAQILNLLQDLKSRVNSSIILITHNLAVVAGLCSRIIVMYAGLIVEEGNDRQIFDNPKHPYTWGLLRAVPRVDEQEKERLSTIKGLPPDLMSPPKGCPFAMRCSYAMKICFEERPPYFNSEEGHRTMCWLLDKRAPRVKRGE